MVAYRTPTDIGSRALQHCGSARIDPLLGFAENSRGAGEVAFCYDKERIAELRKRYWTFAIRRTVLRAIDPTTMLLAPSLWSPQTTFFFGSIVSDEANNLWTSRIPNNLGNDPLNSLTWEPYFGPLSVALYDSTTAYSAGELVYTTPGDGTNRVYLSLQSANSDVPGTGTAYDPTVSYSKNQVVTASGIPYMSLIDLNTGHTPSASAAAWSATATYAATNQVTGSDGVTYTSVGSGNLGNDPTFDNGTLWTAGGLTPWTSTFVGGAGSVKWLQIGGAEFPQGVGLTTLNIAYPAGAGPSWQSAFKNVFLKPAGYLRLAPQNPKPGMNPLGGPSGSYSDDWMIEGDHIVSSSAGPIVLRFVGDFTDVARMDADFCEGLAARIALAICDTITQDKGQLELVAKTFKQWESDALTIDGIEAGYDDPPDDDYLTVRY